MFAKKIQYKGTARERVQLWVRLTDALGLNIGTPHELARLMGISRRQVGFYLAEMNREKQPDTYAMGDKLWLQKYDARLELKKQFRKVTRHGQDERNTATPTVRTSMGKVYLRSVPQVQKG